MLSQNANRFLLFFALSMLGACGGDDSDSPYRAPLEGHWVGTLNLSAGGVPGEAENRPLEASHILEASADEVHLRFTRDQEPVAGMLVSEPGRPQSFRFDLTPETCGFHGSCASITYSNVQGDTADVEISRMEVIYSARWTGRMRRLRPDQTIEGTWRGSLAPGADSCGLHIDPLSETHLIYIDGSNVSLTSTDGRELLGTMSTSTDFQVSIERRDNGSVTDEIEYRNIDSGYAHVTVSHTRRDGDTYCVTRWSGPMLRD